MTIQGHLDTAGEPWVPLVHWNCQSNPNVERLDMPGLWSWTFQRDFYRYSYFQAWKKADIDLLISPVGPSPAPQHGTSRYLGYSAIWNLLDYPGLAFPVTQVNLMQDSKDESYVSRNDDERWIWEHYEAEKEVGAPVGLQLVGQKLEDEKVVEVMSWMVQALQLPFVELFS